MNVGELIQQAAKSKGISAQKLGEEIGRTRQGVYDIYNSRVSLSVDQLLKIATVLREPVGNFLMTDPDAYYDMIPNVLPIQEVLKHMEHIHEQAKRGAGMVNLRIFKTPEGMYIMDSEFRELKEEIDDAVLDRYENNITDSKKSCFPDKFNPK